MEFADYLSLMKKLDQHWNNGSSGSLCLAFGKSDYFVKRTSQRFRQVFSQNGAASDVPFSSYEGKDLVEGGVQEIFQSNSLFESQTAQFVREAGRSKVLTERLASMPAFTSRNHIFLSAPSINQNSRLVKQVIRLKGLVIRCDPPKPAEMGRVIQHLAEDSGLSLSRDGQSFLEACVGQDLFRLENEINKLSLILESPGRTIKASDIAEHLGVIRDDHAFKLTNLLLEEKYAEAQALAVSLMRQKANGISILGILSRHVRNCLYATGSSGLEAPRLPNFVMRSYNKYVRTKDHTKLSHALDVCSMADVQLKTNRIKRDDLIIAEVISALSL